MSSILRALKKLEEEKSVGKPLELNIDAEILRPDHSGKGVSMSKVLVGALVLTACGSGATYYLMKPGAVLHKAKTDTGIQEPQRSSSDSVKTTGQPIPSSQPVQPPQTVPLATKVIPQAPSVSKSIPVIQAAPPVKPTTRPLPVQAVAKTAPPQTVEKKASAQALRVNGIAYQTTSADSMAIINGAPVTVGASVGDVTVTEIQRDRVVFGRNGETFEIRLGQTNEH